jgi:hypothetical protein
VSFFVTSEILVLLCFVFDAHMLMSHVFIIISNQVEQNSLLFERQNIFVIYNEKKITK